MIILCFGGGTDSTAILAGWVERGLHITQPISMTMFADTGGERPETYAHISLMNLWLDLHGMPEITVVRRVNRAQEVITLEQECLRRRQLPSIAYRGRFAKACSQKHKIQPQDKYLNRHPLTRLTWELGQKPTKLIGYDFSETRRWAKAALEDDKYKIRFPLVEWEWTRADCVAAIARAKIPQPGKSACFFCPSSKKFEIDALARLHPELAERAMAMEANAELTKIKGLGHAFSWTDYLAGQAAEAQDPPGAACMTCNDGD